MKFGEAIEKCKNGAKIQREGWNGQDQYIEIASDIEYTDCQGERKKATNLDVGSYCLVFVNPNRGIQIGWLASQSDMLAEDWRVVG